MTKSIGFTVVMIGVAWWVLAAGGATPSTQPAGQPSTPPGREITLDLGNGVSMKLVPIAAGKFMMGSPDSEAGRTADEGPQHEVTITKPFHMGAHEVTQEQYEQVMGNNPSKFKGKTQPVDRVSWDEATEFCKKLSQKTGQAVSLPTEAQWEYACRAGTTTPFNRGNTISRDQANFDSNYTYGKQRKGEYRDKTVAVGSFKPNAWGLYDMHGNVWEWCADWYAETYANAKNVDPQGPDSGPTRVLRGGGWADPPQGCRCAYRGGCPPEYRDSDIGFRVVVNSK